MSWFIFHIVAPFFAGYGLRAFISDMIDIFGPGISKAWKETCEEMRNK